MNKETIQKVLSEDVQRFLRENKNVDATDFALKNPGVFGLSSAIIAQQLAGRQKFKSKVPSFYSRDIIYPPGLNLEQSSSEETALFKAKMLLQTLPQRKCLIDLTGGFGVDSYFFSKIFRAVQYVEPNENLFEIVQQNHATLQATNIKHHNTTAEKFLSEDQEGDAVFIDPSRRSETKKVFAFADCEPNVIELAAGIFETAPILLIKASPLLDLKLAIEQLSCVKKVVVLSVSNEVKELLFLCKRRFEGEAEIEAIDIRKNGTESFSFKFSEEELQTVAFSDPHQYLYEPNSAIMKAGAFKSITRNLSLTKIQSNTHLYTSELYHENFPGRIFRILQEVKPEKKEMRAHFPERKANITTRNYPLTVEQLKTRTGLAEGGDRYLIGFSGQTKKFLLVAERLK